MHLTGMHACMEEQSKKHDIYQLRSLRWLWKNRIVTLHEQFFDGDDDKYDLLNGWDITLHKMLGHAEQ